MSTCFPVSYSLFTTTLHTDSWVWLQIAYGDGTRRVVSTRSASLVPRLVLRCLLLQAINTPFVRCPVALLTAYYSPYLFTTSRGALTDGLPVLTWLSIWRTIVRHRNFASSAKKDILKPRGIFPVKAGKLLTLEVDQAKEWHGYIVTARRTHDLTYYARKLSTKGKQRAKSAKRSLNKN